MTQRPPGELFDRIERFARPCASYEYKDAKLNVYKAKELLSKKWNSPDLKELVLYCRRTYLRYGDRPLLDEFDNKSVIYLVSATYPVLSQTGDSHQIKEWLSIRLVPGCGKPIGNGELEIYRLQGRSLNLLMQEMFFGGEYNFWVKIVSSSRMCGIYPYFSDQESNQPAEILPKRQRYLALSFALIQRQFIRESCLDHKFITEIIPNSLFDNVLVFRDNNMYLKPGSEPGYKILGFEKKDLKVDRMIYSYRFPTYWLNMDQLTSLLAQLLKNHFLSEGTFKHYLKTELSFNDLIISSGTEFSKLGNLLAADGILESSRMTGHELRMMINNYVDDEPELKITEVNVWNESIETIIRNSGVREI